MSFRGMAISAAVLLATGFRATPAAASPPIALHGSERGDAYVLSRGGHTMMTSLFEPLESLERRRRDLDARRRSLEEQERDLDGAESSLERREDEIERKAEAELWRLIDLSIESGAAQPASMSR